MWLVFGWHPFRKLDMAWQQRKLGLVDWPPSRLSSHLCAVENLLRCVLEYGQSRGDSRWGYRDGRFWWKQLQLKVKCSKVSWCIILKPILCDTTTKDAQPQSRECLDCSILFSITLMLLKQVSKNELRKQGSSAPSTVLFILSHNLLAVSHKWLWISPQFNGIRLDIR